MVTSGMEKIFQCNGYWKDREEFFRVASLTKYEAAMWNGTIYVAVDDKNWVSTIFTDDDFRLEIVPSQIEMVRTDP